MTLINDYKLSSLIDAIYSKPDIHPPFNPVNYKSIHQPIDDCLQADSPLPLVVRKDNKTYYRIYWCSSFAFYALPLTDWVIEIYFKGTNLNKPDELVYTCTFDTLTHITSNISVEFYLDKNAHNLKDLKTENLNISVPTLLVSSGILSYRRNSIDEIDSKNPLLRTSFNIDALWSSIIYPTHVFDYKGINLGLLYFDHRHSIANYKALPKILGTSENKFKVIYHQNLQYYLHLYLGGSTKYIEDEQILNDLRRILYEYIYQNSHVTSNYKYLSICINHSKELVLNSRLVITKIKENARPYKFKMLTDLFVFKHGIEGLKVSESKATKPLLLNIEKWLEHYNLYSSDITTSFYLVDIDPDAMIKNFEYISTTHLPEYLG